MKIQLPRQRRWLLLLPVLLALGVLTWRYPPAGLEPAGPSREAQVVPAVPAGPTAESQVAAAAGLGQPPPPAALPVVDIFAVRSWEPPPPPVDTTPPPPQAPPLPFKFIGRIVVPGGGASFMLDDGQRVIIVGVGDTIGGKYRLEKYEAGQLLFRYRPMNVRQALAIGGAP